jgi:hypothetical protein
MTVPTLAKTWQFSANNAIGAQGSALACNRALLRAMKNAWLAMALGPPTVRYSCDSVTAGAAGDAVDRWDSDSDLVWANAGSAHSWIVFQQTGIAGSFQVLMSLENAAGNGISMVLVTSQSAGFTGGTTTARPTATDEQIVLSSGNSWSNLTTDAATRWTVMQSTDGQCNRWLAFSGGNLVSFFMLDKPANPPTGWAVPHFVNAYYGLSGLTVSNFNTNFKARVDTVNSSLVTLSVGGLANIGPNDTVWANQANSVDASWPMFFCGGAGTTAGAKGWLGTVQDLWCGSTALATGSAYPAGSNDFIQVGAYILPWNGGAINLS